MPNRRLLSLAAIFTLAACDTLERTPSAIVNTDAQSGETVGALRLEPSVAGQRGQREHLRSDGGVSFANGTATMWAVRGKTRVARLHYGDGTPFATFTVGKKALVSDAAGLPLAEGDSVKITMRLISPSAFAVEMQPSGLRFNPDAPAVLEFRLDRASRSSQANSLSLWKQETPDSPWEPVPATFNYAARKATAKIAGFTIYAILD